MDQTVRFSGTISWARFKRAQWKHVGHRWLILLMFPVVMTAYVPWMVGTPSIGAWVLVMVIALTFVPLMIALNLLGWRRTYAKSPYLHQSLTGSVSLDKFIVEGPTGRVEMTWDQFVRIKDGDDCVLLYHAPNLFNILAREFFESDDAWKTARAFAMRTRLSRSR